jgi:DNA-binding transcriptional ArsR family regulator
MARPQLRPALFSVIADRFRILAEPARLSILHEMRGGERTVNELVERTGLGQTNVSKHLRLLHAKGFVRRRRNSRFVHYSAADRDIYRLCDAMCGHLEAGKKRRA